MLEEFKKFALRGNVVDLAVGVIIGAAFGAIVNSAVQDIFMPVIGAITGGLDFSNYYIPLSSKVQAGLPYVVVLTNPTTGGVTASYAMLGDVQIAEPGALICFAGPRVIEQTIRETLPEGFQRAEYLLDHGMLDRVIHRREMRDELARLLRLLMNETPRVHGDLPAPSPVAQDVAEVVEAA